MSSAPPSSVAGKGLGVCWIVAAALLAGGILWATVCTAPGIPWNAVRLSPSFALARGLTIYALRDSGAHLGWVYGPVLPLWYLPFGFTDQPTPALMLAAVWNAFTILAPVYAVVRVASGGTGAVRRGVFAAGALLLFANPITAAAFRFIHVDAVCVFWAVVACLGLVAATHRGWRHGLPLAALGIALSVAAKQVSVVLVPATFCWLWFGGHRALLVRWFFWLAAVCGGLAVVFLAVFGAEGMLFNTWLLFSRMPWQGGWDIVGRNLLEVARAGWLWMFAALLGGFLLRGRWRERVGPQTAALVSLLLWLAAWQLPMGVTASLVVDAALNSIHALNYVFLAGLAIAAGVLARGGVAEPVPRLRAASALVAALALLAAIPVARDPNLVWRPYRGQDELVALARQHAGRIYLPWNPLTTLITERKILPFDEALRYLWLARLEPPRAAIQAAVPANALLIYQEPSQTHFALNYFGATARDPAVDR